MIRIATTSDAPAIADIYGRYVDTPITFENVAPDSNEVARRMDRGLSTYPWLVDEHEQLVRGYVYACQHRERAAYRWSVECSVYIREDCRRRGIGRRLYEVLFQILRQQHFRNVYAGITLPNPGSQAIHESMGFESVGVYRNVGYKDDTWHDVGWWAMELNPSDDPVEPVPFSRIADQWNGDLSDR